MGIAGFTDTRTTFEIGNFPAGQTTIMHKLLAQATSRPAFTQHGVITIQSVPTYPTGFGLNAEEQGLPFSSSISNTHRGEYTETVRMKTIRSGSKKLVFAAS